ncbi:hypothetical protein PMIN04_013198, partial [Paraphaeosphaeria minitans]
LLRLSFSTSPAPCTGRTRVQASSYFRNLIARWDDCCNRQEEDSFFVDADPEIFQNILSFMQRPSQFPLFWTKTIKFDYALYEKLEAEADYFPSMTCATGSEINVASSLSRLSSK